jgi:hypothetical protein
MRQAWDRSFFRAIATVTMADVVAADRARLSTGWARRAAGAAEIPKQPARARRRSVPSHLLEATAWMITFSIGNWFSLRQR